MDIQPAVRPHVPRSASIKHDGASCAMSTNMSLCGQTRRAQLPDRLDAEELLLSVGLVIRPLRRRCVVASLPSEEHALGAITSPRVRTRAGSITARSRAMGSSRRECGHRSRRRRECTSFPSRGPEGAVLCDRSVQRPSSCVRVHDRGKKTTREATRSPGALAQVIAERGQPWVKSAGRP